MLSVEFYLECRYAECHYDEYRYAGFRYTECRGAVFTVWSYKLGCLTLV